MSAEGGDEKKPEVKGEAINIKFKDQVSVNHFRLCGYSKL